MRAISNAIAGSVLLSALALAGCGSDAPGSSSTAAPGANPPKIVLTSPAIAAGSEAIPARYTCAGKNVSLPLRWSAVPAGTAELVLLMLSLAQGEAGGNTGAAIVWAVAGLPPTLRQLAPGRLPPGATVGRNAQGRSSYSICPARGARQPYLFMLFASPAKLSPSPGFTDESMFAQLSQLKAPYGELVASYSRT